ncbi:MAG: hypothetical protein RLY66_130 [Candidatus Parcubacteria bacterium]|jgi:dUTP pyrophosphatase
MKLKFLKLNLDAKAPTRAHADDAGMDLYCCEAFTIEPGGRTSVGTGIAFEIPAGHVGLIWEKSGLSHTYGIKLFGGVIDAGYRGEIKVGMINLSDKAFSFEKGHKIAQMIIQKIEQVELVESSSLEESVRGDKGFGSTGK